jgi:hypothetical protein
MSDYEPNELIAVCESITDDGEISGEEVYRLASWLNEHREACFHWPGDLLVQPLQEVWSDGKLTSTELRKIARLLVRIRKEWAKRQSAEAFERARNLAVAILPNIDLSNARLPAIPYTANVRSHTDRTVWHQVDLLGPTCTCLDWRSYRHHLPLGHLSRCCKHVFDAYEQLEPDAGWPGWLGSFFGLAWKPHPQQDWMVLTLHGGSLALASTAPAGWADVHVYDRRGYDRFGYNVEESRWAYGIAPRDGAAIAHAITAATNR